MHEVSVMSGVVDAILSEMEKYEIVRVEEVVLVVGDLTFLGHEQLRFAFEVLTKGTLLEGSELKIETEEVRAACLSCSFEGKVEYVEDGSFHSSVPILLCPSCGGRVDVVEGGTCRVVSVKVVEK
ncbi:MAG: hydrogenase maturation nickel metallochaperone HypA [Methanomassiliicoccales archaeon]|nr:hydrogenase maturation nickel metallochaperone HypA [Methanomassiliicoccales archaeon]